jgi:hypothetical protein
VICAPVFLPEGLHLRSSVENWLRIGIESKKATHINAGYSLGKREVVSSILTGSTRNSQSIETSRSKHPFSPHGSMRTNQVSQAQMGEMSENLFSGCSARRVVLVIAIRPRSEHKMKRSTRQSHWEGSLSVYAHHHAACLDDGVRGFAGASFSSSADSSSAEFHGSLLSSAAAKIARDGV